MDNNKILIVEDEAQLRKILAMDLKARGYEVFTAGDGQEGLEMAQEIMPDLIITDVIMPRLDGNQFLKKLRATYFGRRIPFIVLTARAHMRDYFEAVEVGAFIEKPFEADDLLAKIEGVLSKAVRNQHVLATSDSIDTGKKRVLIVEDDPWLRSYLRTIFNDYGYVAEVLATVKECLEEVARFKPDIIILKFLMEGMNADKLVPLLRKTYGIPVLVYAKTILGGERESVMAVGAIDFMHGANAIELLKKTNQIFHQ